MSPSDEENDEENGDVVVVVVVRMLENTSLVRSFSRFLRRGAGIGIVATIRRLVLLGRAVIVEQQVLPNVFVVVVSSFLELDFKRGISA